LETELSQACGGTYGESQFLKPQFLAPRNAPRPVFYTTLGLAVGSRKSSSRLPYLGHNALFYESLTQPAHHGVESVPLSRRNPRASAAVGGFRQFETTMNSSLLDRCMRAARPMSVAATLALAPLVGSIGQAAAQGAVRSVHNDWQVRCDTPPGAQGEQCALIQSVTAEDRANVGITVIVLKTADAKSRLMRVVAPMGVLLPSGLGLKIDQADVGRAGFVRCLPNGCVAEVVMDETLIKQMRTGQTATFIIFQTPEEGIGFPVSLKGFGEGFDKLP